MGMGNFEIDRSMRDAMERGLRDGVETALRDGTHYAIRDAMERAVRDGLERVTSNVMARIEGTLIDAVERAVDDAIERAFADGLDRFGAVIEDAIETALAEPTGGIDAYERAVTAASRSLPRAREHSAAAWVPTREPNRGDASSDGEADQIGRNGATNAKQSQRWEGGRAEGLRTSSRGATRGDASSDRDASDTSSSSARQPSDGELRHQWATRDTYDRPIRRVAKHAASSERAAAHLAGSSTTCNEGME